MFAGREACTARAPARRPGTSRTPAALDARPSGCGSCSGAVDRPRQRPHRLAVEGHLIRRSLCLREIVEHDERVVVAPTSNVGALWPSTSNMHDRPSQPRPSPRYGRHTAEPALEVAMPSAAIVRAISGSGCAPLALCAGRGLPRSSLGGLLCNRPPGLAACHADDERFMSQTCVA